MRRETAFMAGISAGRAMKGVTVVLKEDVLRPNSTDRMTGRVINSPIGKGDTVCCYNSTSAVISYYGEMPQTSQAGAFFIDSSNRMYDVSNGKLRIRNGLDGTLIDDSESAYNFVQNHGDGLCAYKSASDSNTWVIIYFDGSRSNEITFPFSAAPVLGYRNGVVAAAPYQTRDFTIYTYQPDGTLLNTLATFPHGTSWPYASALFPIDDHQVGVIIDASYGLWTQVGITYYYTVNGTTATSKGFPFSSYYSPNINRDQGCGILGETQDKFYLVNQLHDPDNTQSLLNVWVVAEFDIENYDGPTEIARYASAPTFYGRATQDGHLVMQITIDGVQTRKMMDLYTMTEVYAGELETPGNMTFAQENSGFLWVYGSGVYAKEGWVMYPTTEYPTASPWGTLGYAVDDYAVGETGTAIVLFEHGE